MCPVFVFCPNKPHINGNEYHTICCGEIVIMYGWEIVEGIYHLIQMGGPEFETSPNMNTAGLIFRLMRALCSTGKAVIMNSGFYVWNYIDKKEALLA